MCMAARVEGEEFLYLLGGKLNYNKNIAIQTEILKAIEIQN